MPRLDDPEIKLKQKKPFMRKSLRPWDDPEDFIPNKTFGITDEEIVPKKTSVRSSTIEKKTTDNQLVNNRETIGNQLVNNRETIGNQLVNNRETIGNQLVNNKVNNKETIGNQISLKTTNNESGSQTTGYDQTLSIISRLFGLQKIALFHIVENCKARGLLYTDPITNEFFRTVLNTDIHSVKTTIQRLIKKDLIRRKEAKKGKGGYTIFSISISVRKATIEAIKPLDIDGQKNSLLAVNKETIGKQLVNNKVNNKVNNDDIVVSSSYINTNYVGLDIPENWQDIDLSSLEGIGFNQSHLVQIHRSYEKNPTITLSPELIQSSIDAMAFDLKHNKEKLNFQKSPAVVLLSLLKKAQPYNSVTPDKCVSPIQDALNKHNQMLLSQRTQEQKMLQQIQEAEFAIWRGGLSDEQLLDFCPESELVPGVPINLRKTYRRRKALELTRDYFDAEIWPAKKLELLASAARKNTQEAVEQG